MADFLSRELAESKKNGPAQTSCWPCKLYGSYFIAVCFGVPGVEAFFSVGIIFIVSM